LQRNRIDVTGEGLTVGDMKQIELKEHQALQPLLCQRCGGLMRLVGSEPHPVEEKTDLLTYACTGCEEFLVLPVPLPVA
jgi:hypothetical protein